MLVLHAGPAEMGFLRAAEQAPILLFSLVAGVWIDRVRRGPIVIGADVGRGLLLATIPLAYLLGALRLELLYVTGFAVGAIGVFFQIAYQSYLPSVVRRENLVDANSTMQMSSSAAQIAGPSLSGILVALLTAPLPIVVDVISFFFAAAMLRAIRAEEPPPAPARGANIGAEIRDGMAALLGHPLLRPLLISSALALVWAIGAFTLLVLYLSREIGLDPVAIGLVLGLGSVGAFAGAAAAPALARRVGIGPSILAANGFAGAGILVTALAGGPPAVAVPILVVAQVALLFAASIYNVNGPSLRQALTPRRLLGRVHATYRFLVWGATPLAALLAGFLGELIGLRATMFVFAAGFALPFLWVLLSPLGRVREAPAPVDA